MLCREHEGGASKEGEEEMEGGGLERADGTEKGIT